MAYYQTYGESLCGQNPAALSQPLRRRVLPCSPAEINARRDALVASLLRCVSVSAALDVAREQTEGMLAVTSISWQFGDERYVCSDSSLSDHTIPVSLSLDDQPFGRLLLHSSRPVNEETLGCIRRILDVMAYPLRNLRLLNHALIAAEHDGLTGLKNRRAFDMQLQEAYARVSRYGGQASLLILDMTRFKSINDTYGHDVGDRALVKVAEGLTRCIRQTDSAFRLGGDEFAVILPETPRQGASRLSDRLLDWFAQHPLFLGDGEYLVLHARTGMAQWQEGESREDWFRQADQALYQSGESSGRRELGRLA